MKKILLILLLASVPCAYAQKSKTYTDTYDSFHFQSAGTFDLVSGTSYPVNIILTVNSGGGSGANVIVRSKGSPPIVIARKTSLSIGTYPLLSVCEAVIAEGGMEVEISGSPPPNVDILVTYAK